MMVPEIDNLAQERRILMGGGKASKQAGKRNWVLSRP